MKKSKGFTLAELLIVVAIMAVLVGVAIPVFSAQLNKSKYSVDEANARSIFAELMTDYLGNGAVGQSDKFEVSGNVEEGEPIDITVTHSDSTTNTYKFNGTCDVTFNEGTDESAPSVIVGACDYNNNEAVPFGSVS